jgi:hypothetical protein
MFIINIVLPYNDIFGSVQSIAYATLLLAYCHPMLQRQPHSAHNLMAHPLLALKQL